MLLRAFLVISFLSTGASAALFQNWFSGFADYFDQKISNSCHQAYETYLTDPTCPSCQLDFPADGPERATIAVVNCLLNDTEEYVKAALGVGTVVLGLLPTVLSFSGSTTTEIGLLAQRRPLLATLLALSSPSIYPTRALDYEDPVGTLRPGRAPFKPIMVSSRLSKFALSSFEYALALAATANVGTQIWQLSVNSPSSLGPDFLLWTLLWPLTSLVMHTLGTVYVSLRVRLRPKAGSLVEKVSTEFHPSASQERYTPQLYDQTFLSGLLAWLASVLTICHCIYGTAALSSQLFVSTVDAVYVALRLWASAVVARTVVMYELSSLAFSLNIPDTRT